MCSVFRIGGDEFAMIIQSPKPLVGATSWMDALGAVCESMTAQINGIGARIKELVDHPRPSGWADTRKALDRAVDRNGTKIDMTIVSVSPGVFVPAVQGKETNWIGKADTIALHHAKKINQTRKNGFAVYDECKGGLASDVFMKWTQKQRLRRNLEAGLKSTHQDNP